MSVSGVAPLVVTFTDTSEPSQDVTFWYWNFGDGSDSNDQNPVHAYAAVGVYTVSLTVSSAKGTSVVTDTVTATDPVSGYSGTITGDGAPLDNAFVSVMELPATTIATTTSAVDGSYSVTGLTPGKFYWVRATDQVSFAHNDSAVPPNISTIANTSVDVDVDINVP